MQTFKWGAQFITGLSLVDEQHQHLVEIVNAFGQVLSEDATTEEILVASFKELARYAQDHFETEKNLMAKFQVDPRHISSHLEQHQDFVVDITNLMKTIKVDNHDDCCSLFEYLIHWLVYHILGSDKSMAQQIDAIKKGVSSEDAYLLEERGTSNSTEPLLDALNGLFALVSKHNKTLMELNRTLEERVNERTKDLSDANKTLEEISVTDHLTQLPNRRFAMSQLELLFEESVRLNLPLSCLMVDADNFKIINDTYGHDAGDVVLQRLATELKDAVRTDDIVCRLGGDEFFIICPNTNLEGALHLGEHTLNNVSTLKIKAGEGVWDGSVSIGVASYTAGMKSIDVLIKAADESVYLAKRQGRNCVRTTQ